MAMLAGLSGDEFPVRRCSGSRLVGEEQREFSRDSPLKFLPAHLKGRWGSRVTCGANSYCYACWCCRGDFCCLGGKRNVMGNKDREGGSVAPLNSQISRELAGGAWKTSR